jgi:type II secretory pathway pseudopilin PulG
MIELVFVIVIIGILAAVAIPRLAANRDDATAATCVQQIGNIISESTTQYAKLGYTAFDNNLTIGAMTNVATGVSGSASGITEAGTAKVSEGITYNCEGGEVVEITFGQNTGDASIYEMNIDVSGASTTVPAAIKAVELVKKNYNITDTNTTISL